MSKDFNTTIVCDDNCASFQEEIGGKLITYENLIGFHFRNIIRMTLHHVLWAKLIIRHVTP